MKLFTVYLGFPGTAALILFLLAVILVSLSLFSQTRFRVSVFALLCTTVALMLAQANLTRVARIPTLPSAAEIAERERQEIVRQREYDRIRDRAGGVRFVEDAPGDELDPAGLRTGAEREVLDRRRAEPLYRQQGRQQRIGPDGEVIPDPDSDPEAEDQVKVRALPAEQLQRARALAHFGLRAAYGGWALVGLFFLWDYLRRLNRFTDEVWPLPLSNPWLHALEQRRLHVSLIPEANEDHPLCQTVVSCLRKGEQVFLLGLADPCPEITTLNRLPVDWPNGLRVPKWVVHPDSPGEDPFPCLEAAWHGRAWVVVPDVRKARALAEELNRWFAWREKTGASALTTFNLFLPADLLPSTTMEALIPRANAMEIRIVTVGEPGTPNSTPSSASETA